MVVGGGIIPKDDNKEQKYQNYIGTNLSSDIICEPKCSDNRENKGDNISGNRLITQNIYNKHRYIFSMPTL